MNVAVLASGGGTNLQALLDAAAVAALGPARIVAVGTNVPGCGALARARHAGVATFSVDHRTFAERAAFDRALVAELRAHDAQLIVLAGFMRLLTPAFLEAFPQQVINIHPSLLPAFRGLDTHRRALEAGMRLHGCTVHFVRTAMDDGPIIVQAAVPVWPTDTEDALAARVLRAEHRCYPLALKLCAERRVRVEGERCRLDGVTSQEAALINPLPELG